MRTTNYRVIFRGDELYHHGIKGQKWGVRRFQNEDGTLTEEGKARYIKDQQRKEKVKEYAKSAVVATVKATAVLVGLAATATILSANAIGNATIPVLQNGISQRGQSAANTALNNIGNNRYEQYQNYMERERSSWNSELGNYQRWW